MNKYAAHFVISNVEIGVVLQNINLNRLDMHLGINAIKPSIIL